MPRLANPFIFRYSILQKNLLVFQLIPGALHTQKGIKNALILALFQSYFKRYSQGTLARKGDHFA